MQVWVGRPGNKGGVGGAGPICMKMWSIPGQDGGCGILAHQHPRYLELLGTWEKWPGRFLGHNWSISMSFQVQSITWIIILCFPLFECEIYSLDSSKMMGDFKPVSWSVTSNQFSPFIGLGCTCDGKLGTKRRLYVIREYLMFCKDGGHLPGWFPLSCMETLPTWLCTYLSGHECTWR